MINHQVTDDIKYLLLLIFNRNSLYIITSSFAIYFTWQKMTRKVYASFTVSHSRIYHQHISSLILSNKRDNTVTLASIRYMMEDGNDIEIAKFDNPLIIKPYDTQRIEIENYSYLLDSNGNKFNPSFPPFDNGIIYLIDIYGKEIECTTKAKGIPRPAKIKKITGKFNGVVLTSNIEYIFTYKSGDKERNLLIDKHGFIHGDPQHGDMPFHFNKLSGDYVENIKHGLVNGYHDHFDGYMLIHIKGINSEEIIFNKSDIDLIINNQ